MIITHGSWKYITTVTMRKMAKRYSHGRGNCQTSADKLNSGEHSLYILGEE
jgi:hypothetical protein